MTACAVIGGDDELVGGVLLATLSSVSLPLINLRWYGKIYCFGEKVQASDF